VDESMALGAQSNEILLAVVTQRAPCLDVMHLQIRASSTELATPPVAPQNRLV
jgi:hypothetical protein